MKVACKSFRMSVSDCAVSEQWEVRVLIEWLCVCERQTEKKERLRERVTEKTTSSERDFFAVVARNQNIYVMFLFY